MRNKVVTLARKCKSDYYKKIEGTLAGPTINVKKFWQYSKELMGGKVNKNIPTLEHEGNLVSVPKEKAELFNLFFANQHKLPENATADALPHFTFITDKRMPPFLVSEDEILNISNKLETHKASGPDGLSNRMIKMCSPFLCKPLALIFNQVLSTGHFPTKWKEANVSPVHKKGGRQIVSNYRPISLLCNVSKIFEKILYNKLYEYLQKYNLLTSRNSGFKPNESTIAELISICDKIYRAAAGYLKANLC